MKIVKTSLNGFLCIHCCFSYFILVVSEYLGNGQLYFIRNHSAHYVVCFLAFYLDSIAE